MKRKTAFALQVRFHNSAESLHENLHVDFGKPSNLDYRNLQDVEQ